MLLRPGCLGAGWLAGWMLLLFPFELKAAVLPATFREYQVKAAFLYNFALFVEWPAGTFPTADAPLIIGVLGEDPFGGDLVATMKGEKAGSRSLVIRHHQRVEDIQQCHILFVSQSESARLEQIFASLKGRSILTVGEVEGFSSRGGMIRLVTESSKVRMRINVDAAKRAGLTISSKLLRPAQIVTDQND
jgi:hypothetical protein